MLARCWLARGCSPAHCQTHQALGEVVPISPTTPYRARLCGATYDSESSVLVLLAPMCGFGAAGTERTEGRTQAARAAARLNARSDIASMSRHSCKRVKRPASRRRLGRTPGRSTRSVARGSRAAPRSSKGGSKMSKLPAPKSQGYSATSPSKNSAKLRAK